MTGRGVNPVGIEMWDGSEPTGTAEREETGMEDLRLELLLVPVTDVDRAKRFYSEQMGFAVDVDHQPTEEFRVVQLTPPGSSCSITIGKGMTDAEPGAIRGTHLVVTDIERARTELVERGVEVGEIRHFDGTAMVPGKGEGPYNSFADIADPDGNTWVLQENPNAG
jgi:predicted enzyme related to lactoylglutathione lyase